MAEEVRALTSELPLGFAESQDGKNNLPSLPKEQSCIFTSLSLLKLLTKESSGLTSLPSIRSQTHATVTMDLFAHEARAEHFSQINNQLPGLRPFQSREKRVHQFVLTDGFHTPHFASFYSPSLFPNSFIRPFPCPYRHTYQLSSTWTPEVSYIRTQTLRASHTSTNVVSPPHLRLFSGSFSMKQTWTTRMHVQLLL